MQRCEARQNIVKSRIKHDCKYEKNTIQKITKTRWNGHIFDRMGKFDLEVGDHVLACKRHYNHITKKFTRYVGTKDEKGIILGTICLYPWHENVSPDVSRTSGLKVGQNISKPLSQKLFEVWDKLIPPTTFICQPCIIHCNQKFSEHEARLKDKAEKEELQKLISDLNTAKVELKEAKDIYEKAAAEVTKGSKGQKRKKSTETLRGSTTSAASRSAQSSQRNSSEESSEEDADDTTHPSGKPQNDAHDGLKVNKTIIFK